MADWVLMVTRWGPAVFFTIVALFYTARIVWVGRRLGYSPVTYGRPGTAQHRVYLTFRVFRVLIWLACVARAVWPPFDAVLVALAPLARPPVMVTGNFLMIAAFAFIVWQNLAMGSGWRSGIQEPDDTTPLRTQGVHAWCRHPMLAAIMLGQLGLFLAVPSLFTLVCLVVGIRALLREARLEEEDLARRHGERWGTYSAATRKWPWGPRPKSPRLSADRRSPQ